MVSPTGGRSSRTLMSCSVLFLVTVTIQTIQFDVILLFSFNRNLTDEVALIRELHFDLGAILDNDPRSFYFSCHFAVICTPVFSGRLYRPLSSIVLYARYVHKQGTDQRSCVLTYGRSALHRI